MIFSYARVSTAEQNVCQQTQYLKDRYQINKSFEEKVSGKDIQRLEFTRMKEELRSGDTVIAYDISRLGRNVVDVLQFADFCLQLGVGLIIDQLGRVDVTSSTGKMILTTLSAVAEMQRSEMLEKQAIGIKRAKEEGKFKGKQISQESKDQFDRVQKLIAIGESTNKAIELIGMNRSKYFRLKKSKQPITLEP